MWILRRDGDGIMVAEVHFRTPGGKERLCVVFSFVGETYMQGACTSSPPLQSTLGGVV